MSQKNFVLTDMVNVRNALAGRAAAALKAAAKRNARRVMRHESKATIAFELKLMAEDARAAMTVRMASAIQVGFDTRKRNIVERLAASRELFMAFAEQQCIPLKSLAEVNAETTWAPPRNRTTFEIESNGTKLVLASCAL